MFYLEYCVIEDSNTFNVKGLRIMKNGLYYLMNDSIELGYSSKVGRESDGETQNSSRKQ